MSTEYKVWVSIEKLVDGDSHCDLDLPLEIGRFRGPGGIRRAHKFVASLPTKQEEEPLR